VKKVRREGEWRGRIAGKHTAKEAERGISAEYITIH
jgi:hypothetical protein